MSVYDARMSSAEQRPLTDPPSDTVSDSGNTAEFRAYYQAPPPESTHGLLYRVFVAWWRDKA